MCDDREFHGECDFCGENTDLIMGPYDNLICTPCAQEFQLEQEHLEDR